MPNPIYNRSELLLGEETMKQMQEARVIIFGVGGVGSWCAESLIRTGIGHLTIVDSDRVCVTNINRQMMATTATIGMVKVEALRNRLLEINPEADIKVMQTVYCEETADSFDLNSYDFIIDCIDSLKDKALLIERACASKAKFFSSMGAALKTDPSRIMVAEFWKVKGCPLARALRQRFKRSGIYPKRKFQCVFSDELHPNRGTEYIKGELTKNEPTSQKAQINGSLMHITAIFGLTLAGLVIKTLETES